MKRTFLTLLTGFTFFCTYAQNTFPTNGNVLIGTPGDDGNKLQVNGNISARNIFLRGVGGANGYIQMGAPNDGYYYNSIGIYSQYKIDGGYTWDINQDWQGNHLTAGLGVLYFTLGSGYKVIKFDDKGSADFAGSVKAAGSLSVGNNSGTAVNRISLSGTDAGHYIYSSGTTGNNLYFGESLAGAGTGFHWVNTSNNTDVMTLNGLGYLGIGTSNPDALLSVAGKIHTQEVKVDMSGWSDFVFKKDYYLQPLTEVKNYISQNHHLPDMPSEQEVIKDGVNLGEMVKLQTRKIEELTLYLIEKEQQLAEQKRDIEKQEKNSAKQDARIAALEKALHK